MKKLIALFMVLCMLSALPACQQEQVCEHTYEEKITTAATCGATGVKTFTCTKCGNEYTEELPMLEHSLDMAVTKDATCSGKGTKTFTCTVCGYEYTEEIPTIGHSFDSTVTKEATCVETGTETITCTVCGVAEDREIPTIEHDYTSSVTKKPTCTKEGVRTYTCLGCNDSYTEPIEPTGHNWVPATCTKPETCSSCGKTGDEALGHYYGSDGACDRCGDTVGATFVSYNLPYYIYYDSKSNSGGAWITEAEYTLNYYYTSTNELEYNVTFSGCGYYNCTTNVRISFKLYDSEGYLVYSDYVDCGSIGPDEWFKKTARIYYDIIPGETYTLMIVNSGRTY